MLKNVKAIQLYIFVWVFCFETQVEITNKVSITTTYIQNPYGFLLFFN